MFDADSIIDEIREKAAKTLLKNAIKLQVRHKRNLSRANPAPHKNPARRGEFPKARTFNLRDAVAIEPKDLATIEATGRVRVGVLTNAIYGEYLFRAGWKGIIDSHNELKAMGAYN